MVWKVLFGAGMLLLDPLKLAVLESFLPNGTSQYGPPVCHYINKFQAQNDLTVQNTTKIYKIVKYNDNVQ